ncbi:MAG: hypothetical protein Q9224_007309, partial [Gallowayella concinna]
DSIRRQEHATPAMALNPSVGDAQRTLQTTNCDEAANAPEVDTAVLAPEWRGENAPPEVCEVDSVSSSVVKTGTGGARTGDGSLLRW